MGKESLGEIFMNAIKKKRLLVILAALAATVVIISAFVHAGEDDFISDPARLAGKWEVTEIRRGDKLISDNNAILIYIDKNSGYHLWKDNPADEQMGELQKRDGQLCFDGKDGWTYALHGKQRQLIVTVKKGKQEETWICEWDGYCLDAQLTNQESWERYFAIQKKAMAIEDETQKWLYTDIMNALSDGYPEGEAISKCKKSYINFMALAWYAEEHGLVVTDERVKEYMNLVISAVESPGFEDYRAALRKVGITERERVESNAERYRMDCIWDNLYKEHPGEEWDAFEQDIVNRFHHTKAYRALKIEMETAVEKIKEEWGE